jgi:hypothetical protein
VVPGLSEPSARHLAVPRLTVTVTVLLCASSSWLCYPMPVDMRRARA